MKLRVGRNRIYLVGIYLAMGLLYLSLVLHDLQNPEPVLWATLGFVLFVLVSHDAMLRIISQATGHYQQRNELGYFSAFVELNRKIHNFLDVEDVLVLVNDALRHHIQVRRIRYLLAWDVPTRQQATLEADENGLELRNWDGEKSAAFHDARFEEEVKARGQVMSFVDAPPAVQAAFVETGTNLLLPIMQNQRLLGVLLLGRSDNQIPYTGFEYQMFDYLANQLSIIIDRIRVYAKVLRKTAMDHAEKMQVMQSLSANIAHEMRTPLAGIRGSISGLEEYLPQLLESHEYGVQHDPQRFAPIREGHLQKLRATPRRVTLMIDQANTVIDMLLVNLKGTTKEQSRLDPIQAAAIVEQAVDRYPFRSGERERVHLDLQQDFCFLGVESFFVYVLFNLLKNALYSLQSAQKGEITIRLQRGSDFNRLYFRDTGCGVDPTILGRIFDGFFTTKSDGTGAGLAFCRRTIMGFGGEIDCHSVLGEYAEFIIKLPGLSPDL